MHREGHYGVALLVFSPIAFVLIATGFLEWVVLGGVVMVGGAMLPDLDMDTPGLTHRGITHTVWFALAVGSLVGFLGVYLGWQRSGFLGAFALGLFGLLVGALTIVAHILADALTPMGVQPFKPFRDDKYTFDVARAANPIANKILLGLGVGAAVAAVYLGRVIGS